MSTSTASPPVAAITSATVWPPHRSDSATSTSAPSANAASGPRAARSAASRRPARVAGSATARRRSSAGRAAISAKAGRPSSTGPMRRRMTSGRVRATTSAPRLGGHVGGGELLLVDLDGGQAAEQVPVERAVGGGDHVGHEVHAVLGDLADAGMNSRVVPGVVTDGGGQGDELVGGGGEGRHGMAVAVAVGLAQRGREAEGAVLDRPVDLGDHRLDLLGRRPGR